MNVEMTERRIIGPTLEARFQHLADFWRVWAWRTVGQPMQPRLQIHQGFCEKRYYEWIIGMRLVDLTHPFNEDTIYWPTAPSRFDLMELASGETPGGWFYSA